MPQSSTTAIPRALLADSPRSHGDLEEDDLSLRQVFRVLRKRKRIVVWTSLSFGLLTVILSFVMRPYYASTAMIEITPTSSPADAALGELGSNLNPGSDTKVELQTDVTELSSPGLGAKTITLTHFEDHVSKLPSLFGNSSRPVQERGLPLEEAPVTREALLKNFENHLTVVPVPSTRLIQVTFEDPDPKFAAQTTKALIEEYERDGLDRRNNSTVQASEWMASQITSLKQQVQLAQQRLIDFQRQTGLVYSPSFSASGATGVDTGSSTAMVNPLLARLTQLNEGLVSAEANRITREAVYRVARTGDLDALSNMAEQSLTSATGTGTGVSQGTFEGLQGLRAQQTQLKLELTSALQTFGAKNPHLTDVQRRLDEVDKELHEEVTRVVARTELDFRVAKQTEDAMRQTYDAQEREVNKLNDSQLHLAILQQEAESTRTLYEDLYTKLQESKLQEGIQKSNISLISAALPSAEPVRPKKVLYTAIGLFVGWALGIIAAFIRESLDETVTSSIEVEYLTGMPLLGWIPGFKHQKLRGAGTEQSGDASLNLAGWDMNSFVNEGYRTLRTSLLLSRPGSPPKTILFTSPLPAEGKTTTTFNLAMSFASTGQRVLALDADMRKPGLHEKFNIKNGPGLSNLLTSNVYIENVVYQMPGLPNLHLITAGQIPPNPPELLGSTRFASLLTELSKRYDVIMLDSPPSVLLTDAMVVSAQVDAVVVVVRSGRTTRAVLTRVVDALRLHRSRLLGFVLNEVDTSSAEFFYGHGYGGGTYGKDLNAPSKA